MINIYKTLIPFLALSAGLSGCASRYTPATDGPRATVTFRTTDQVRYAFVSIFSSRQCDGRQAAGLIDKENGRRSTTRVPADKELIATLQFSETASHTSNRVCNATVAFVPKDGAEYEVTYDADATAARCVAWASIVLWDGKREPLANPGDAPAPKCSWS